MLVTLKASSAAYRGEIVVNRDPVTGGVAAFPILSQVAGHRSTTTFTYAEPAYVLCRRARPMGEIMPRCPLKGFRRSERSPPCG